MDNQAIFNIIKLLKNEKSPKWQTANSIAKKLDGDFHGHIIEKLLISHYKEHINSNIRYSSLPSKRSLQILWGHVEKVGNRKLFDIFKEDKEVFATYLNTIEDERNIFLSHSFSDSKEVIDLANKLVNYNLNPWVAEVDITYRSHINNEVIKAIENLPFFGIYLSKNVLQSAWSAKEFEFAIHNKRKLFAFIQEDEHDIINLIENNTPIDHINIHELLRKVFDKNEISDNVIFFLIAKNANSKLKKIKHLKEIQDFI